MKREDFTGPPCNCIPCQQAGVSALEQIRDRYTGKMLHAHELRRWYEARERFQAVKAKLSNPDPVSR